MIIKKITYKDSEITAQKYNAGRLYTKRQCICCGEDIEAGSNMVLLINNDKYFPNILLHKTCLDDMEDEQETGNFFEYIEETYEQWKHLCIIFDQFVERDS